MGLSDFATTDLADAHPDKVRACVLPFKNFGGLTAYFGQIRTVVCYEDSKLVQQVIREPGNGRILVIDGGGSPRRERRHCQRQWLERPGD